MKTKLIAMSNNPTHPGLLQLKRSLDHFGWDYEIINAQYIAYGSKQIAYYNYMKAHPEYTHFFIVDAHDVFVLGTMNDALNSIPDRDIILFNAEKGCWPHGEWAKEYPEVPYDWKYLNGGAAFVSAERFIKMFEENPISHYDNDQVNLARIYLDKRSEYNFQLDTDCRIFQSVAFEHEDDFDIGCGVLCNNKTCTVPIIIHGNGGGTNCMPKIYNLI